MLSQGKKLKTCYTKFDRPELPAPITVRIKFCKIGNLQFISHLDLQRAFHRILVRAGIPMWYTKGFNPHAKLVFGLPLSVGTESMCEMADLRIEREISLEDIKQQLNASLTDEMYVLDAYIPERKFADIAYASYKITLSSDELCDRSAGTVEELFSHPINMIKKSKSGEREVDITQYIRKLEASNEDGKLVVNAIIAAGNTESLNPEYLVTAIKERLGTERVSYTIMRNNVFDAELREFR